MHKITRKIYFIILCLTTFTLYARGIYYNDRLMIYIDNKVTDFSIEENQLTTSISEINNILKDQGVNSIAQWLPNTRPTDRNGNIFLNRYYVVEFESIKNDIDEIPNLEPNTSYCLLLSSNPSTSSFNLSLTNSKALTLMSIPTHCLLSLSAATAAVAQPQKGSKIVTNI